MGRDSSRASAPLPSSSRPFVVLLACPRLRQIDRGLGRCALLPPVLSMVLVTLHATHCPRRGPMLHPQPSPPRIPMRCRLSPPPPPGGRWRAVVPQRHRQDRSRNVLGRNRQPGTVVPGARVPDTAGENVVLPPGEEVVGGHVRRVHDRTG